MNLNEKFVITINRELGSGGRTVGRKLAEKLNVPFYDKALINALEKKYHLTVEEIERLTTDDMFKAEVEILKGIAEDESCIVAGRSGFFVFRKHPNHLSILIQASMDFRVARVARKKNITPEEATKIINKVDKMRENYVNKYTKCSRYDARNYDLVISADGKTEDEIVDIILRFIG